MPLGFDSTETRPTVVKLLDFLQNFLNKRQQNKDNTFNPFCKYIISENLNTSAMHYFFLLIAEEYDEYIDVSLPSSKPIINTKINSNLDTT